MGSLLTTALVASGMATLGLALIPLQGKWLFLPRVLVASNLIWLCAGFVFRRRLVSRRAALGFGVLSPFIGAILLGGVFAESILGSCGDAQLPGRCAPRVLHLRSRRRGNRVFGLQRKSTCGSSGLTRGCSGRTCARR